MPTAELASRHIVITGASRGIGHAVARACAAQGARLSICARSAPPIEDLCAQLGAVGGVFDITDPAPVKAWMDTATRANGPIDVLLNNAALLGPKCELATYPLHDFSEVMHVNVTGTFVVTQAALPYMRRPGGVMLHMSSYLGRVPLPRYGAYCASKFAVEGLAGLVAEEHKDEGLISCAIDPGMVQTEMLKHAAELDDVSQFTPVNEAAAAFCRLMATVTAEHNGKTLMLSDF